MIKNKVVTTELYEKVGEYYITVKETDRGNDDVSYDLEKEKQNDGRSRSSLQVDEAEARVLFSLLKEMLKGKE